MTLVQCNSGLTLQFPRMVYNLFVVSGLEEVIVTYISVHCQHVLGLYPTEWCVTTEVCGPNDIGCQVVRGQYYAIAARANFDNGINDSTRLTMSFVTIIAMT
jgi:hypothetical protein